MKFEVRPSNLFLQQIKEFDDKTKRIILEKKALLSENPFRYKRLESHEFNRAFAIKFSFEQKAKRLIYVVTGKIVLLCGVLDRDKNYRDLDKLLNKVAGELGE